MPTPATREIMREVTAGINGSQRLLRSLDYLLNLLERDGEIYRVVREAAEFVTWYGKEVDVRELKEAIAL